MCINSIIHCINIWSKTSEQTKWEEEESIIKKNRVFNIRNLPLTACVSILLITLYQEWSPFSYPPPPLDADIFCERSLTSWSVVIYVQRKTVEFILKFIFNCNQHSFVFNTFHQKVFLHYYANLRVTAAKLQSDPGKGGKSH